MRREDLQVVVVIGVVAQLLHSLFVSECSGYDILLDQLPNRGGMEKPSAFRLPLVTDRCASNSTFFSELIQLGFADAELLDCIGDSKPFGSLRLYR